MSTPPPKFSTFAVLKHGKSIENLGKCLQNYSYNVPNIGYEIEEYGLLIQYYAEQSLMYAFLLQKQKLYSTDLFFEALRAYVQAVKAHTQAVKLYTELIKAYLNSRSKDNC